MLGEFLPAMTDVMTGLTEMISGDEGGLEKVKQGVNDFLQNLSDNIPQMVDIAGDLISTFIDVIIANLPQIVSAGVTLLGKLIIGIIGAIPDLVAKTPEIIKAFIDAILGLMPSIIDVGNQIIEGVWQGIENARQAFTQRVHSFFSSIVDSVKGALGIESPSKVFAKEVGHWIPAGIAKGIEDNGDVVGEALDSIMDGTTIATNASVNANLGVNTSNVASQTGLIEGLVNGMSAVQASQPVNMKVQLVLSNGQLIAEQIFDDLINVSKQRGVSLATS